MDEASERTKTPEAGKAAREAVLKRFLESYRSESSQKLGSGFADPALMFQ